MKYTFLFLLLASNFIYSQSDSSNTYILPELKIRQNENGSNVVYEFKNPRNKIILNKDFLTGDTNIYKYKASIQDVNKIVIIKNPNLIHVLAISFIGGAIIGAVLRGYDFEGSNNATFTQRLAAGLIAGGIVSFIAGGIAFLITPDKEYSLSEMNLQKKRNKLKKIFEENKIK
jgi:hypothetical protein